MSELVFQLVNDEYALRSIAKLDQGLEDTAAVVLVAQLGVLLTNGIDALLHDRVLLLSAHLLLLHEQAILRDAQLLHQV